MLLDEDLIGLEDLSTASVINAIETFTVRNRNDGFISGEVRCRFPELQPMVGRALTVKVSSPQEADSVANRYWKMWEHLEHFTAPSVLVMQNIGSDPSRCAYFGEVMATLAIRLGATGLVTDGGVRDLSAVRGLGFHYFSRYVTPSHGNFQIIEVGVPVVIGGQEICSGDVLHGDEDGVVIVPESLVPNLRAAVLRVERQEAELMEHVRGPGFDLKSTQRMRQEWD